MTIDTHANGWPKDLKAGGFPRVAQPTNDELLARAKTQWEITHQRLRDHYDAQHLAALRARIGPLHVVNGHMPLAAGEVAELRPKLTVTRVMGVLVDLGATLGFIAFVAFLLSRAGA